MSDVILPLESGHGEITAGKEVIASVELPELWQEPLSAKAGIYLSAKAGIYDTVRDLAVDRATVTSKINDVPMRPAFDQVKILTSTVKISDSNGSWFNKDVDYDNHIKRQAAIKLMEQLLDEGFITFQKIATVEPAIILQAKIIAIQQEDI